MQLSLEQAAERLGKSARQVRYLIQNGALRDALVRLTQGCHRFDHDEKAIAYRAGRDAVSLALCELVLTGRDEAEPLIRAIEQDLMAAFSGLLRRLERRARR